MAVVKFDVMCLHLAPASSFYATRPIILSRNPSGPYLSSFRPIIAITITMAKGDGKQRRKKKSETESSLPVVAVPQTPAAPRVSNNINIPIRRQIRYGRMNKQLRQLGSSSFRQATNMQRTKYRRTWDEEEMELKAEERRRKGQDPDWDVVLNQTAAAPLVIVDGYNIIHKWPRLKKHMIKGDTARARQTLVDDLENLRSIKGWRIEVVFDGAGRNSRAGPLGDTRQRVSAAEKATSKEISKHGIRTVYTGAGIEADSYIEARCAQAKNVTSGAKTGTFIVATVSDMIRSREGPRVSVIDNHYITLLLLLLLLKLF